MQKKWEIRQSLSKEEKHLVKNLAFINKCPMIIAELLYTKKLVQKEDIDTFFSPSLKRLHDPFLFSDMNKAVDRIIEAIDSGEKITIYGDYDVDGTTATALLFLGLSSLNAVVDYFIPHRMIDGYGLTLSGLEQLHEGGTSLIISVDCGIIAFEEVATINSMGMQIIITDHHNAKDESPAAYAIINPKKKGDSYPFKELSGVGVAYKLLMAIYGRLGIFHGEYLTKYLDLVAVGTIADIVSLTDENRVLASIGLIHLTQRKNHGLNALMNLAGITNRAPDVNDIMFAIAPRINAAGRMGSAMRAVELLTCKDPIKSQNLAEIIERENSLRQQIDYKTLQEADDLIHKKYKDLNDTGCIVISSDQWHPGVIGIVASKIVDRFYRPTIMISNSEGMGSGSGRSITEFDLFGALEQLEDYVETFGGHKYAVGLTILPEYIETFEDNLQKIIKQQIKINELSPKLMIHRKIELYEVTPKLLQWLNKFTPFGTNNPAPVFYTLNVQVEGYPYIVGKNHLKLKVIKDGCELDLIGFNLGNYLALIKNKHCLAIAYTLELINSSGKQMIQGNLKDIKIL